VAPVQEDGVKGRWPNPRKEVSNKRCPRNESTNQDDLKRDNQWMK